MTPTRAEVDQHQQTPAPSAVHLPASGDVWPADIRADSTPSVHLPESGDVGPVDVQSVDLSGCGEWVKTCEVKCVDGGGPIPNVVHFIKADSNFHFYEWVAVMAARKALKPKKIFVHSRGELKSCWWNRIRPFVEHHIVPSNMWVKSLNGRRVIEFAHKADFMRNALLYQLGGIYSDTDCIATKSFDDLLHGYQTVVARQARQSFHAMHYLWFRSTAALCVLMPNKRVKILMDLGIDTRLCH